MPKTKIEETESVGLPVEEPSPATEPERRRAPEWAKAKGMDAAVVDVGGFPKGNIEHTKYAAARGLCGWTDDTTLTEAEFDAAVARAWSQPL